MQYAWLRPCLDLPSLRLLGEALANFDGTALAVSRDRHFLDRICASLARELRKQPLATANESTPIVVARDFPCASPSNHLIQLSMSTPILPE